MEDEKRSREKQEARREEEAQEEEKESREKQEAGREEARMKQ